MKNTIEHLLKYRSHVAIKRKINRTASKFFSKFPYYWELSQHYYKNVKNYDVDKFNSPINPVKMIWVDPQEIDQISRRPIPYDLYAFGEVRDGNWDCKRNFEYESYYPFHEETYRTTKFEDYIFHQSLKNHFLNDVRWEETEFVHLAIKYIEGGESLWKGSTTKEEVLDRCEYIDKLYKKIKRDGFKTQNELNNKPFLQSRRHEILADIGRDGTLLFVEGRHRLSIAKILQLDQIPICILVRHANWMEYRDQLYNKNKKTDHPDLTEF